jgi:hypothetical protein
MKINAKYSWCKFFAVLAAISSCYGMSNGGGKGDSSKSAAASSSKISKHNLYILVPEAEALHAYFEQLKTPQGNDILALQHFARKSHFIERIASKTVSLDDLESIIKEELRLFAKNIMQKDALLQWEFWGSLDEIGDLDTIAKGVVSFLIDLVGHRFLVLNATL